MDDEAVSDVVGAVLLTAMLVAVSAVIALDLADREPDLVTRVRLDVQLLPGADGWGTGDERLLVTHRGGHPISMEGLQFRITVGQTTQDEGPPANIALDGTWRSGEHAWFTRTIQASDHVALQVLGTHESELSVLTLDIVREGVAATQNLRLAWDTTEEWDASSGTGLRQSRNRVRRLGFFEEVDVTSARAEKEDEVDLTVSVREARTGTSPKNLLRLSQKS